MEKIGKSAFQKLSEKEQANVARLNKGSLGGLVAMYMPGQNFSKLTDSNAAFLANDWFESNPRGKLIAK